MTIQNIGTIERWIGLSTDAKPDASRDGSTFHELDTGKKFIWNRNAWTQDLSAVYAFLDLEFSDLFPGDNLLLETDDNFLLETDDALLFEA